MSKKILVNILSEQTIPNYIAIKEVDPDLVIAIASERYEHQIDTFTRATDVEHVSVSAEPYDLQGTIGKLTDALKEHGTGNELIINFTGGTKILSTATILSVATLQNNSVELLYVATEKNCCELFEWENGAIASSKSITINSLMDFNVFIQLAGESIKNIGLSKNDHPSKTRKELSEWLFKYHKNIRKEYGCCFESIFGKRTIKPKHKITIDLNNHNTAELEWFDNKLSLKSSVGDNFALLIDEPGQYFCGGWLEELCFNKLLQSDGFDEVIGNVVMDLHDDTKKAIAARAGRNHKPGDKNEIDVVVTKGVKVALIECKAGKDLHQDFLYKLTSLTRHFCGIFGQAFLVTTYYTMDQLKREKQQFLEKAEDMKVEIITADMIKDIAGIIKKKLAV